MSILSTDLKYRLSGGASNSDPTASLGGAISSTDASSSIFNDVTSLEATSGYTSYRCIYVKNNHGTLTAIGTKVWISSNTPSTDTNLAIGLGTSATNATEQIVSLETSAPTGVSFTSPSSEGAALVIGDLTPGSTKAVWMSRVVGASAATYNDTFTITVKCDTLP